MRPQNISYDNIVYCIVYYIVGVQGPTFETGRGSKEYRRKKRGMG